jgi:hypothetical protein
MMEEKITAKIIQGNTRDGGKKVACFRFKTVHCTNRKLAHETKRRSHQVPEYSLEILFDSALLPASKATGLHKPEECHRYFHRRENFKFRIVLYPARKKNISCRI